MILIQVLCIVLTQFSVGSLLMVSLLPTREIRVGFFTLNSLLSAICAGLALVLMKVGIGEPWADMRFLGLTVIGATLAYGCFKLGRMQIGRLFLIASGFIGLFFGLLPLAGKALALRGMQTNAQYLFDLTLLAGALLLGATHVGMILGHWYLLMRRLSFEYLQNFARILLAAVAVRALLILFVFASLRSADPKLAGSFLVTLTSPDGHLFFFVFRLIFGVVVPFVLGLMILRCVQEKANQAATGLLYVAEISVLFGEIFAAVLLI